MNLGLDGKVALVAASSRGLGRAVAEELADNGAKLVLCARNDQVLKATAQSIEKKYEAEVLPVAADLAKSEDVDRVVDRAFERFGSVDVLVTNGGGPPAGRFEEFTDKDWDDAVEGTLKSVVRLVRRILPGMRERRWGRIVNITSIAVKQPVNALMLSNSVRSAVTGFARTLANEVAESGVTVNNVMPGYTRTERLTELAERMASDSGGSVEDAFDKWAEEIPIGRVAETDEFSGLVAFLASERASYITGQSIAIDGGWIRSLL
ncbi:MAG: SDR family oxidoreductase [Gemmatimonadota bacterium]|nr:SDR family oxidoreductase [Gemmatimonadota bacterium]